MHRQVAGGAVMMASGILLSRVLGLVRDRVIAHQFGQGFQTDVYNAAFTIPDLMFFLLAGGALSQAFIPVFTEYLEKGKEREAWRVFSVVATTMTVVISLFILLGEIFTYKLVALTNPGYSPDKIEATVHLTRILLPAQLCFFLGGLMMGTLTARNIFIGQAFGPVIYNLGIIFGGVALTRWFGVAGLCWGAVAGAVIGNLIFQWVLVRRTGGRFVWKNLHRHLKHPGAKQVWMLMLPVILGLALPQISTIIGRMFAAGLGDGPQSALMNANRLMQVPLGVFAQATGIAIFPTLSMQAARNDMKALRGSVNFGIRSILFLTVPSSLLMIVLALPIVQLLLQSGKFNHADAEMTAATLRCYSVGIFAWSAHAILARGFNALQETRVPVIVGSVVTVLFLPLYFPLRAWFGVNGIALAITLPAIAHMLALLVLLRKRLGGIEGGRLLLSTARIALASGLTSLACYFLYGFLTPRMEGISRSVAVKSGLTLGICLGVSILLYGGLALALQMEEANLLRRLTSKFRRR